MGQVRLAIRVRHYSRRTEEAYVGWIRRFIVFHDKQHPSALKATHVSAFLSSLASTHHVSASTQNQALSAVLFLYRHVLSIDIGQVQGIVRAATPPRLPVVLTRAEVSAVLAELKGTFNLLVALLYGSGLRLQEALNLRVKDLEMERGQIVDQGNASFAVDNAALATIYNAEWRRPAPNNSVLLTAQLPTRDAVDAPYAALVGAGHEGVQVPYDTFWGARYAVVRDPEGHSVGLESPINEAKRSWPPSQSPDESRTSG
jgi:integrase